MNATRKAGLLLAAALAAAGCASAGRVGPVHPGAPAATPALLCRAPGEVTSLVIERFSEFPSNHIRFTFPPHVVVADPGQARAVATAVCGLPQFPRSPISCPLDLGVSYTLDFVAAGHWASLVKADAAGCQGVSGAGLNRWAGDSPRFWDIVGRAAGVPSTAFPGCEIRTTPGCPKDAAFTS